MALDRKVIFQSIISGGIVAALAIPGILITAAWHGGSLSADVAENTKNIAVLQSTMSETQRLAILTDQALRNLAEVVKSTIEDHAHIQDELYDHDRQIAAQGASIKDLQDLRHIK
jgi:septal ring factor EnvC (AmiA/AmiB activator)